MDRTVPLASPIFTGGSISGQVKTAEALQKQALVRYQQSVQNAFRDVEDALIDQKRSRDNSLPRDSRLRLYALMPGCPAPL